MSRRVIYATYRTAWRVLGPVALFYALVRVLRNRKYLTTIRERLGYLPPALKQTGVGSIWIHAVSVGEVLSAAALIRELRKRFEATVSVSTATLAGYRAARESLAGMAVPFYAPIDTVGSVRRVLRALKPSVVVVLETEIWPNLFREAKRFGCGLLIANGRISDRAFPKYAKQRWFFKEVLCWPDRILAQSAEMRERFLAAGAWPDRVTVAGNLKFDFEPRRPDPDSPVAEWLRATHGPVLIAASTTADQETDEDRLVLEAFRQMEGWRLILAPRKPERFGAVTAMLEQSGAPFWRRTAGTSATGDRVLLLDTIGELPALFGFADVVFMGGTLTDTGGHNFLEPALAGKPIVVGPRLENFREMADDFRRANAFTEIRNGDELAAALQRARGDSALGARARARAEANRGAARRIADEVVRLYERSIFCPRAIWFKRALLGPLAALWKTGARRQAEGELRDRRWLDVPVISLGNLTTGGTGKTPLVLHLAKHFREQNLEPVVLTRGYGRVSPHRELVLRRGSRAGVWHTGDEPQIILRSGLAGLGIGRDRYLAGIKAQKELEPDVFLLDDGFSHQRLSRDLDIVLIDSLDPFGGGEVIPLGRQREPVGGLARADVFVITRCEPGRNYRAIENRLRELNPKSLILRSRTAPREWVSLRSGQAEQPPRRTVAVCGLGNPASFWQSLTALGIEPLDRIAFGDHHRYPPRELECLVRHARTLGAEALLTTQKDAVNFEAGSEQLFEGMPVFWLRIEVEIEDEAKLLELVNPAGIRERRESDRHLAPAHP